MTAIPHTSERAYDWMLQQFGPNGENWHRGQYLDPAATHRRCLLGMVGRFVEEELGVTDKDQYSEHTMLREVIAGPLRDVITEQYGNLADDDSMSITKWNDTWGREFAEVRAVIEKARVEVSA